MAGRMLTWVGGRGVRAVLGAVVVFAALAGCAAGAFAAPAKVTLEGVRGHGIGALPVGGFPSYERMLQRLALKLKAGQECELYDTSTIVAVNDSTRDVLTGSGESWRCFGQAFGVGGIKETLITTHPDHADHAYIDIVMKIELSGARVTVDTAQ
jgi:hypothetical protein